MKKHSCYYLSLQLRTLKEASAILTDIYINLVITWLLKEKEHFFVVVITVFISNKYTHIANATYNPPFSSPA